MALNLDSLGLSAKVTAEGISAPDYQTILSTLISYFQQIYGSDAYLEPDSKDGQMVALMALAIHDANNMAITVYNCFSPATGYGAALTSNVKINGISRKGATNSTVDLLLTGTAGTTIINGSVKDSNNVIWRLPVSVVVGVDGGDVTDIAQAIRGNKGQGTATHGTTSVTVPDKYGNPHVIKFSRSSDVPVYARIKLKVFTGYTSQIGQQIQQAISDYINSLMIGDSVLLSRIYSPANLGVVSGGNARYYDIQELTIGKSPGALSSSNIDIRYNESASCTPENIVITVES
ncbi:hypothetical protein ACSFFM_003779 [Escherichia coli]